jgi:hypothetical protein
MKSCGLLSHTPLWKILFFSISSHIHDHHMDRKIKEGDLYEIAHLELAHHFFFLHLVDALKIHMRACPIFFFGTYLR